MFNTESVIDEVGLEMEFMWNGDQKFQLMIRPFPKFPVGLGIGQAVSKLLAMRVGVSNIWFKGRVRVAMKPLIDRIPLVGAVKVTFIIATLTFLCRFWPSLDFMPNGIFGRSYLHCLVEIVKLESVLHIS